MKKRKKKATMQTKAIRVDQMNDDELMIFNIVNDMAENGDLMAFLDHIRFPIAAINDTESLWPAIRGHYRIQQGYYDADKCVRDLATYPPIASRIVQLMETRPKSFA